MKNRDVKDVISSGKKMLLSLIKITILNLSDHLKRDKGLCIKKVVPRHPHCTCHLRLL